MKVIDIIDFLNEECKGIIAIDGDLGSGKTRIANEISDRMQMPVIHIDDFLIPNTGQFLDSVKYFGLKKEIKEAGSRLVIEGICLLDILNKINVKYSIYFFIKRKESAPYKPSILLAEVAEYKKRRSIIINSANTKSMNRGETNQLDVDIAYLKTKGLVAVVLAIGGMTALAAGAYVLASGISTQDSAVFKILGAEISAEGIGAVILVSSVLWAYFAYLARPKYSRRMEVRNETGSDGSQRSYQFESSTMAVVEPPEEPF